MYVKQETIETDVLVIGGGIAGCFAAMRASEFMEDVTLLEKASIRRGGSVGPGMDEISTGIGSPIPGAPTLEDGIKIAKGVTPASMLDPNILYKVAKGVYDRILDFERFGVKIREDDGSYTVIWPRERGHFNVIEARGEDFKTKLGEAVHKTKVNVVERTMAVDLLTHEGTVTGAVALNVRNGKITTYLSKATVLSTGVVGRVYIPPDGLFMTYDSPTNSGDGTAMAYRAGAELVNMEFGYLDYVSCRDGGGVFGLIPFERLPALVNQKGEKLIETWEDSRNRVEIMVKEIKEGRGPVYWDCRNCDEETLKLLEQKIAHEYPITQKWYKQWGIDIRKDLVPIQIVPCSINGGLLIDENFRASLKGLYAAGDETSFTHGLDGASSSGYMAGEYAAKYALEVREPIVEEEQVQRCMAKIRAPRDRREGVNPVELEEMVRSVTTDYVGYERSGVVMEKGLELLEKLKEEHVPALYAENYHELMRCMEVQNILDTVEIHILASLMRKESRPVRRGNVSFCHHHRVDYPETDPEWARWIVVRREDGEMRLSTREIPSFREEG